MSSRFKILKPDFITKELDADEFYRVVTTKSHLVRRSKFIAPKIGSANFGKFLVEFEDEPRKRAITTR